MLKHLISFSLKHSSLVILIAAAMLVYTIARLPKMSIDVFPELNAPTVVILTEAGGLAADEVEQNVTFPIEASVNGLPGVRRVRSASAISLSLVWVEFDWGTDIYRARQLVGEKLASAKESLPPGIEPTMTPISSITGEIMLLAVTSPDRTVSELDLRSYAEYDLRNKLLAIPGVSQVSAIGGELPEYQININQDRLALYNLTMQDVVEAARKAHSTASAGYLSDVDRSELPMRQAARVTGVRDIASTMVTMKDGLPITIGEVADVTLGGAPKRGTAANQGNPAVVLTIQKSPGTNTLALTKAIDVALDQIEKSAPQGISINKNVFRQSHFIQRSVDNVVKVLLEATIIVAVILILFLLNVRTTIITLTALPLSLAAALLTLDGFGMTLNVMTLGGLAVAIGELVDDAIIDVENVHRRLEENALLPLDQRQGFVEVIYSASNEIRSSVVYATVLICIVFLPLMFLDGLEGRFFKPLAATYIVSIMASLLVALTVTPALCKLLLRPKAPKETSSSPTHAAASSHTSSHSQTDGFLVRWLKHRYAPALQWSVNHRKLVLAAALIVSAASLLLARTYGTSFLPEFREGSFTVFVSSPPGTSLAESNRSALGIEQRLIAIDGVLSVTRRTGRAERDEHAEPVSNSELDIMLEADANYAAIRRDIAAIAQGVPGVTVQIGQPIEHRLSHILSGTPAAIAINVYGEDLSTLRSLAKQIESELKAIPGTRDVTANREVLITSVPIRYRHAQLAAAGLTPADAAEQVQMALYGEQVAEVNQGLRRYAMVVRLDSSQRETVDQVQSLILRGHGEDGKIGPTVRLRDVADIGPEKTPNIIARENAQRKAVISCNVADGYNLGDLVAQVKARIEPIVLRESYYVEFGGQFEAQQSASRTLLIAGAGIAVLMLLLLQLSTGSFKVAALVMINLPLATIGGIAAIFIADSILHAGLIKNTLALFGVGSAPYLAPVLSISSLVGFITLFGIAVRNGILLVNHYRHLIELEHKTIPQAIIQGSMERLVPILMTALSAALGLLPLALASGKPGSELLAPLAIVVLGGLVTSTFLNLFVVPAGFALIHRKEMQPASNPPNTSPLSPTIATNTQVS